MAPSVLDPYAVDDTPRVHFVIGEGTNSENFGNTEVSEILGYSYTTDILTLTDSATIDVANPDGINSQRIPKGSAFRLYMADPNVDSGKSVQRLTGIVTNPKKVSNDGGSKVQVQASDRGWFLDECDAPLWLNLTAQHTFATLLDKLLKGPRGEDLKWGFQNADGSLQIATDMGIYTKLNQGRAGIDRSAIAKAQRGQNEIKFVAPLQVEAGTKIGGLIVDYAKRVHRLVNIAPDGTLLIWQPNYQQDASYRLEYHGSDDTRTGRNGILSATLEDAADGIPTDVSCVTRLVYSQLGQNPEDPNADKVRGQYKDTTQVPYYMRATFGDENQIGKTAADARAKWYFQRKVYDAWTYTVEVYGHSQGGVFWAPDSIISVDDTVNDVQGNFYLSACKYVRDRQGTKTVLTIKKSGLLAA